MISSQLIERDRTVSLQRQRPVPSVLGVEERSVPGASRTGRVSFWDAASPPAHHVPCNIPLAVELRAFVDWIGFCAWPLGMGHVEYGWMPDDAVPSLPSVLLNGLLADTLVDREPGARRQSWRFVDRRPPGGFKCAVDLLLLLDGPTQRVGLHRGDLRFVPRRIVTDACVVLALAPSPPIFLRRSSS